MDREIRTRIEARWGRPLAGVLAELYVVRGHSEAEVAKALGCSQSAVHKWMVQLGIPRRSVRTFPPASAPSPTMSNSERTRTGGAS